MREIEFRGQTRKFGEKIYADGSPKESNWEYGGFTQGIGNYSVIYSYEKNDKFVVYADTVGQYTGLKDKNGTKIFEGDILKGTIVSQWAKEEIVCYVEYQRDSFVCISENKCKHKLMFAKDIEVIGNIYDNPELLKAGA